MNIITSLLPSLTPVEQDTDVAIVIDVLRATSVMATALSAGASQIVTCREVSDAFELAERFTPRPLLCGERGCQPISGFDLGNSPAEYSVECVRGRSLLLTTTNGTRAIEASRKARRLIAASFLNVSAVIESLSGCERVHLVCAGTDGEITAEDVLLAGAIARECETRYGAAACDDPSILAKQLWSSWFSDESQAVAPSSRAETLCFRLRETRGGRNLLRVGYEDDLQICAAINSLSAVPELMSRDPMVFKLQAS